MLQPPIVDHFASSLLTGIHVGLVDVASDPVLPRAFADPGATDMKVTARSSGRGCHCTVLAYRTSDEYSLATLATQR